MNETGDSQKMGKSQGSDRESGQDDLSRRCGPVENPAKRIRHLTAQVGCRAETFGRKAEALKALADYMAEKDQLEP